jgi:hypothetical protein
MRTTICAAGHGVRAPAGLPVVCGRPPGHDGLHRDVEHTLVWSDKPRPVIRAATAPVLSWLDDPWRGALALWLLLAVALTAGCGPPVPAPQHCYPASHRRHACTMPHPGGTR